MELILDENTKKLRLALTEDEHIVVFRRFSPKTYKVYTQICLIDEKGQYHNLAFAEFSDMVKKDMKKYAQ